MAIQTTSKDIYGDSGVVVAFWNYDKIECDHLKKIFRIRYVPYTVSNDTKGPLADKGVWFSPHIDDYPFDADQALLTTKGLNHLVDYIEGLIVSPKYNKEDDPETEEIEGYAELNPFYGLSPVVV